MTLKSPFEFKRSNFTFTVLYLKNKNYDIVKKAIQEKIYQSPDFFKNVPIIFNIANFFELSSILKFCKIINNVGLKIIGVTGCTSINLCQSIKKAGIQLFYDFHDQEKKNKNNKKINKYEKTRIINDHVRSGQRIYAVNCDLIINTNVSAGAELISDGNIHIYGIMRGRVLAGASGDVNCQIYCTHLEAELISIAGQFWLNEQIPSNFIGNGARLFLINNELTIDNIN